MVQTCINHPQMVGYHWLSDIQYISIRCFSCFFSMERFYGDYIKELTFSWGSGCLTCWPIEQRVGRVDQRTSAFVRIVGERLAFSKTKRWYFIFHQSTIHGKTTKIFGLCCNLCKFTFFLIIHPHFGWLIYIGGMMISPGHPKPARLGKLLRFFPGSGKEGEGEVSLRRA